MVTLLFALAIGAVVAGMGLLIAPREYDPRPTRVMRIGVAAAMPGVLLGLMLVEDLWLDTHAASLATSVVGSTLAVLGAAFLPREKSLDDATFAPLAVAPQKPEALPVVQAEPGFTDCVAYLWRLRVCRRAGGSVRSSTMNAML